MSSAIRSVLSPVASTAASSVPVVSGSSCSAFATLSRSVVETPLRVTPAAPWEVAETFTSPFVASTLVSAFRI